MKTPPARDRKNPGAATLSSISFLFCLIAMYPAFLSFINTAAGPGAWTDGNFWGLVAGVTLQSLGLATQIVGPILLPGTFHVRVEAEAQRAVWAFSAVTFGCILASLLVYGLASAPWSGLVAFAGQAMAGMVQLMLVFGS